MAAAKPKGKGFGDLPAPLDFKAMKKAFATPGIQKGERAMAKRIAHNRGVSIKKALVIGAKRTARGVSTAGIAGPKDKGRGKPSTDAAGGKGTVGPKTTTGPGQHGPVGSMGGMGGDVGRTRRKPTGGSGGPAPRAGRTMTRS